MSNKEIIKKLNLAQKLLELHQAPFQKIRAYQNAVSSLENCKLNFSEMGTVELEQIDGIGKSMSVKISEIITTGSFEALDDLLKETPEGIIELMGVSGLGPKKLIIIWQNLNIKSAEELLAACEKDEISKVKGFGKKTQENIKAALVTIIENRGKYLYGKLEPEVEELKASLQNMMDGEQFEFVGEWRRVENIISGLEVLIATSDRRNVQSKLANSDLFEISKVQSSPFTWNGKLSGNSLPISFKFSSSDQYAKDMVLTTGNSHHLNSLSHEGTTLMQAVYSDKLFETETQVYESLNMPYIIPELREGTIETGFSTDAELPKLLVENQIQGVIHAHSNYSDGENSIEEMASYCKDRGYTYLGLTDHSQSAFYANGLQEYHIIKQHEEIDALQEKMTGFTIFKGIESDILNDGSLDYREEVLRSFDFIIASIHAPLNMTKEKATSRLIAAIENPFTNILGHLTGRLLLKRDGYPVDHKKVIDACSQNNVCIEINANPSRLDLDWKWIPYALEKEVMLSVNPDAHTLSGVDDIRYGVLSGRKGGLTPELTLNAHSTEFVDNYFKAKR